MQLFLTNRSQFIDNAARAAATLHTDLFTNQYQLFSVVTGPALQANATRGIQTIGQQ